jgi:hypothetical protein
LFTTAGVQVGFLMAWMVLWFQTSGQVIGCLPSTLPPPPASCGANPTPPPETVPGTGSPSQLEPTPVHDPNKGAEVCGTILAILGAVGLFFGGGPAAVGVLIGGIEDAMNGEEQLNWGQLACQMYWVNMFMYNGLSDLHKVAVLAGLQHPYASDLDISGPTSIAFGPEHVSYMSSDATCKSRALRSMLQPWNGNLFVAATPPGTVTATWTDYPANAPVETPPPGTPAWELTAPPGVEWPSAFIDDISRNPGTASILDQPASYDSGFPAGSAALASRSAASFGPAVQAALAIINAGAPALPNWNLDGDRSLGWLTWQLTGPYNGAMVATEQES